MKYKVSGEREVLGLEPGSVLEADPVLGLKGYDLNALVESGNLVEVNEDTPVGPPAKPKPPVSKEDVKKAPAPKAKPSDDKQSNEDN